jgi:PBP1b-binding outer membrane lipoprotein LpoB
MTSKAYYGFIGAAVLIMSGCRQPDGPVPAPNANVQEELVDVTRDLQYIAVRRDPQAPQDLAADLGKYAGQSGKPAVEELSRRTAGAVAGSQLSEQAAQRLTHNLWLAITARDISERQIESLQNDTQALLMSVGVAEDRAHEVALQVGEVQRTVTNRPRRWYELF